MHDRYYEKDRSWMGYLLVLIIGGLILWGSRQELFDYFWGGDKEISYSVSNTTDTPNEYTTTWFTQNAHDVIIFYDDLNGNNQRDSGEDLFNEQLDMWFDTWVPNNTAGSGLIEVWYTGNPYELYVRDQNGWSYPINEGQARSEYITAIYPVDNITVFELKMKR